MSARFYRPFPVAPLRPREEARWHSAGRSGSRSSGEAEIDPRRRTGAVECVGGVRAVAVDPVQEQVRRPAVGVWRGPPMAVRYALIGNRIADFHRQRGRWLVTEIVGHLLRDHRRRLAAELQGPGDAVAIVEGQGQAVLAGRAVAVDAADIAFAVNA